MHGMVRNIKISSRTRQWIRRHERRHGTPDRQAVTIRKHTRFLTLTGMQVPIVVAVTQGTAHCGGCGSSRPAYVERDYGVDPVST